MTREAARRRIEALDYSLQSNFGDYGERDHEAMKMAIEALSTSENPNKWIPVSERLPEKEGRYLTTIFNGIRYIVTSEYSSFSNCWFQDNDECASDNVIAWMPLPEPYMSENPTGSESEDTE